ncbi:MAG TPA: PIN domain-containing protein [Stellaceae bacterium]
MATRFFDTNILIYAISRHPDEVLKQKRATELLASSDGAISVQVLQEFYFQVTRPTRPGFLSHELACGFIESWRRFAVQEINLAILDTALEICRRRRFSYWDSAIIAAARALGCRELYTEDLSHGREVEGVIIINPFR